MRPLQRSILSASRHCRTNISRQSRRFAHDESHGHKPHNVEEPVGKGVFIALISIPVVVLGYNWAKAEGGNPITRWIASYDHWQKTYAERNALHAKMVEQAGADRLLFHHSRPAQHIELRFPEVFENYSPYAIPAGHGSINLDKVIEHYNKEFLREEEKKLKALKEGKLGQQKADPSVGRAMSRSA